MNRPFLISSEVEVEVISNGKSFSQHPPPKKNETVSLLSGDLFKAKTQVLYAEGIEMALEQLVPLELPHFEIGGEEARFTTNTAVASPSREELSVLRGIAEELGLLGGADAQRKFAAVFGVKQVQSGLGGTLSGGGEVSKKRGGNRGKHGKRAGGGEGRKSGKTAESQTADLLKLRREAGSPVVLVGRNNLQNDRITFSVGRAHELWFHARGVAGAHVLLRLEPGQEAEEDDLAFAADVAVYFSKARQVGYYYHNQNVCITSSI